VGGVYACKVVGTVSGGFFLGRGWRVSGMEEGGGLDRGGKRGGEMLGFLGKEDC